LTRTRDRDIAHIRACTREISRSSAHVRTQRRSLPE